MTSMDRTGLPRPLASPSTRYETDAPRKPLPVPWINGDAGLAGDFYAFRDDCSRAGDDRLCCICGDPLRALVAIGAYSGGQETSGGWGHPRCIQMAVRLCPHFTERDDGPIVAWLHMGPGVGVDEPTYEIDEVRDDARPMDREDLQRLARENPWGDA